MEYNCEIHYENFSSYGLNSERNFLKEAGECVIELDHEDLVDFMIELLQENGCPEGAVFAIDYDMNMYCAIVDEESEEILVAKSEWNMDWFKQLDGELRFCCYALIEEIRKDAWKIFER